MSDVAQTVGLVAASLLALFVAYRLFVLIASWIRRKRRPETRAIRVIGIGGGGSNAVDRMVAARIAGVTFVACNTDAQALRRSSAPTKLWIGESTTRGLGSGGDPEVGRKAAEEDEARIARIVGGADLVFITAGLGGGTGSGAAPIVGANARLQGALTIAIVTKPFAFEGTRRRRIADSAAAELAANVDAIITIPNDRVADVVADDTSMVDAFRVVDDVLLQAVKGIIDLLNGPGLINLDFADVRAVMHEAGPAIIGLGRATGENRAIEAARQAVGSPLLEMSIQGASGILFNVAGPPDLGLREVREAADEIRASADPDANIIFGASLSMPLGEDVRITLVATGLTWLMSGELAIQDPERPTVKLKPSEQAEPAAEPPASTLPANRGRKRQSKVANQEPEPLPGKTPVDDEPPTLSDAPSTGKPTDEEVDLEVPSFLRRKQPTVPGENRSA